MERKKIDSRKPTHKEDNSASGGNTYSYTKENKEFTQVKDADKFAELLRNKEEDKAIEFIKNNKGFDITKYISYFNKLHGKNYANNNGFITCDKIIFAVINSECSKVFKYILDNLNQVDIVGSLTTANSYLEIVPTSVAFKYKIYEKEVPLYKEMLEELIKHPTLFDVNQANFSKETMLDILCSYPDVDKKIIEDVLSIKGIKFTKDSTYLTKTDVRTVIDNDRLDVLEVMLYYLDEVNSSDVRGVKTEVLDLLEKYKIKIV